MGYHAIKALLKKNPQFSILALLDYREENFDDLMNIRANNLREYYYYSHHFTVIEDELHTCSKDAAKRIVALINKYNISQVILAEQLFTCTQRFLKDLSKRIDGKLKRAVIIKTDPHGLNQLTNPPMSVNTKLKSLTFPVKEIIFECVPMGALAPPSLAYRWIEGLTLQQDIYMVPGEQRVCHLEDMSAKFKDLFNHDKDNEDVMFIGARILHADMLAVIERTLRVIRSNRIHVHTARRWIQYIRGKHHETTSLFDEDIEFIAIPENPMIQGHYNERAHQLYSSKQGAIVAINALTEWFKQYHFPRNILLSSYMVTDHDAQDHSSRWTIRFENMFLFYRSVHKLRSDPFEPAEFTVFICQAGVNKEFIKKYSTSTVRFVAVDGQSHRSSVNDERFFVFQEFLQQNPIKPDYVLYTDLFDVLLFHNPFEFIHENSCFKPKDYTLEVADRYNLPEDNAEYPKKLVAKRSQTKCYDFFPGRDEPWMTMFSSSWIKRKFGMCDMILPTEYREAPLLNAGVMGANYEFFMDFLQEMTTELMRRPAMENCNMGVYNFILHTRYSGRYFSGTPFTSPFTKESPNPDNYIKHK
eukprot:CAMPEP_0117418262 /NCGR_PEP_ID=MMETSP0758-20121206/81_1 /TAXON_ID=63605 /ORGANISM="Percolomonas cosmopolitus, Strain AE-1 (ATCC 50343)" /LENGTH=584 /DNA_ID=CAMNT_0005198665 /DNA_START=418 /DNA_END=2172 /DNA_ORIENTATION=+